MPAIENEIVNPIGMKLKLIPAGEFLMGSPDSDKDASITEKPQHRVRITQPFYLGVYPVTQGEYMQVVKKNPSYSQSEELCPVERVSWYDAVAFCNALSQKEGLPPFYEINGQSVEGPDWNGPGYRLPREAEWEYACRAGTTTRFSFGDDENALGEYAWYSANSGDRTHPVGEKKPNAFGLYDMHGNVWELCWNGWVFGWVDDDPRSVIRAGCFFHMAQFARSAARLWSCPWDRGSTHGLRVARVQSVR
jgi:formylglycine-generating enzyme required for sulfatase activity